MSFFCNWDESAGAISWKIIGAGVCTDSAHNGYSWYWANPHDVEAIKTGCEDIEYCVAFGFGAWGTDAALIMSDKGQSTADYVHKTGEGTGPIAGSNHASWVNGQCYALTSKNFMILTSPLPKKKKEEEIFERNLLTLKRDSCEHLFITWDCVSRPLYFSSGAKRRKSFSGFP